MELLLICSADLELNNMADLSTFDPNSVGNPNNNIFGLPFTEEDARLVIVPVPWEVTVSYGAGTSRNYEKIFKASLQVDLFDPEVPDGWKQGFFMREANKTILLKSDYLRKEAELLIDYICKGEDIEANKFMSKSQREINEGSLFLNQWVYEQTKALLDKGKLVAILGGDHSTPLGFYKALAEKYNEYGILQVDAHLDLRCAYEGFNYSHASIMYNAFKEVPAIKKFVHVGIRDYCGEEYEFVKKNADRLVAYYDKDIKERQFEGETWKQIVDEIVDHLPQYVYISFDIDGLDPKLCPTTGTPVSGGFEVEQVLYLFSRVLKSGRKLIGFDLVEIGVGENDWDANVGARILFRMCNQLISSNS